MRVKTVLSRNIITIHEESTLMEAALLLFEHQVSGLLVVDTKGELVGLLSEKDLYQALYPDYHEFYTHPEAFLDYEAMESRAQEIKHWTVKKVMIRQVYSVSENDPVMKVGAIMLARHINRLPVLNERGRLIGIVSRRDIYQAILKTEFQLEGVAREHEKYQEKVTV